MKTARIIANIVVALVLVAILVGLTFIMIDERCSRNVSKVSVTFEEAR